MSYYAGNCGCKWFFGPGQTHHEEFWGHHGAISGMSTFLCTLWRHPRALLYSFGPIGPRDNDENRGQMLSSAVGTDVSEALYFRACPLQHGKVWWKNLQKMGMVIRFALADLAPDMVSTVVNGFFKIFILWSSWFLYPHTKCVNRDSCFRNLLWWRFCGKTGFAMTLVMSV